MKSHSRSTQDVAKSVLTPTEPAVSTLCANTSGNLLLARANTSPECCWHRVCQHCANVRTGPLGSALGDYIEAALMLKYNQRMVG